MIKLFRNIRQSLLAEGKTSKYLKYAFGEIVLVVIGILIALQINNWNNLYQRKVREITLLKNVKSDLLQMGRDINMDHAYLTQANKSHFKIMDALNSNNPYDKYLCFDFKLVMNDEYIYPLLNSYNAIKEEGMEIISNDSIRFSLITAFEVVFPRISKEHAYHPDISEYFKEFTNKNFTPNKDTTLQFQLVLLGSPVLISPSRKKIGEENHTITKGYVPNNFEELKKSSEFRMLLDNTFEFRLYKIQRYEFAKIFIEVLTRLIEEDIQSKGIKTE